VRMSGRALVDEARERSATRPPDLAQLQAWARELGFSALGVATLALPDEVSAGLRAWLAAGMHGDMDYMARHERLRTHPQELVPGAVSALMVTIEYTPAEPDWRDRAWSTLGDGERAFVARYALGRDYHKVVRHRLQQLAERIGEAIGPFGYRAFCDSAPVMEVELATRAGLGWRGKHTLLLHPTRGSISFIGTLYTDLPLEGTGAVRDHCGHCARCIEVCPTRAIVAPYRLDARRCIAYLTIEHAGSIPVEFRPLIGNRVFGCDDCQLACPWNKFAQPSAIADFAPRHGLDSALLLDLFRWDERTFAERTSGSAIRRIGHERWLRNLAVAIGNAEPRSDHDRAALCAALNERAEHPSPLVREHVAWALVRLQAEAAR
jgi:epoxyqueuosine reductase